MNQVGGKKSVILLVIASLSWGSVLLAESVGLPQAQDAAHGFLAGRSALLRQGSSGSIRVQATGLTPAGFREVRDDDGAILAYVADLEPRGFVALSADTDIAPVIAYSFRASFPTGSDQANPLYRLLRADMKLRTEALTEHPELKTPETARQWALLAAGQAAEPNDGSFQQWPPEGTTSTEGWLTTAWVQGDPYNVFCPKDPVDGGRCYVGCVATAFAQIVNYHRLCAVSFGPEDSYTSLSSMDMDADDELYDFPPFTELNGYLNHIRANYAAGIEPNDTDAAALSFACGVAVHMDFGSDGSGAPAYAVREALVERFGYHSADLFGGLTEQGYVVLQENLINGLPALLTMSPPDNWGGHAVVCDGYNTDGEYHLNFGWGTTRPQEITEAWYRLPTAFLYRDTVITESILNIRPAQPVAEVDSSSLSFYAAPGEQSEAQILRIENATGILRVDSVTSPDGFLIDRTGLEYSDRIGSFTIDQPGQGTSIHVVFKPARAGGYYGPLVIRYEDGTTQSVVLKGWSYEGGTTVASGSVSGTWSADKSPYFVTGDLRVPTNEQLTIEPGVKVLFVGPYGLTVGEKARLIAQGNAAQPIEFTAWNRAVGWTGLRFVNSGRDDVLSHCSITYARKDAGLTSDGESASLSEANTFGGAIYCDASDLVIENCRITNNLGATAGAIYCVASYPVISNSVIVNNTSVGGDSFCGGICCADSGVAQIRNCTIANNFPGGVFSSSWDGVEVTNTILWGNGRYQIQADESAPMVTFCDVQGGFRGEGNLDIDPCFFDPSEAAGIEGDGISAHWALRSDSPCINAGKHIDDLTPMDLAGGTRVYSDVIDLGAYENRSDLPLMTVTPSTAIDAGFVGVNASTVETVTLSNTGKLEFTIVDVNVSDGAFSVGTPVQNKLLLPGDSVDVDIRFGPTREAVCASTLLVRSTSSNAPAMQIGLRGVGTAGTSVPAGSVSGSWRKSMSPYTVTGDIHIPRGQTLTIEPGVIVKFAGHFSLTVGYRATLRAVGTDQDGIVFTAIDITEGWAGIRFINSAKEDQLKHCTIEYALKDRTREGGFENLYGGAILCCSSPDYDPGVPLISGPTIDSCLIARNLAFVGGGVMCYAGGDATVTNCVIADNYADMFGAGIASYYSDGTISNNVIARNAGLAGGGIMNWMGAPSIQNNTIVANEPSAMYLEATTDGWVSPPALIVNNIIWHNEIWMSEEVSDDEYDIRYNDVQGGWQGAGNLDVDPLFADAENGDYHLKSQAGRWNPVTRDWTVDDVTSPCIDAGDPASNYTREPQSNGNRVDMGAYGGTEQASKSPSGDGA